MSRQSHNGQGLPALFANNSKINYANIIDNPPNPLNSSVSLNHKQGTNPTAKGNFRTLGQAKR
jgi:hypothetical protein